MFADQERVVTAVPKALEIGFCLQPAFGNSDYAFRHRLYQLTARADINCQCPQIAIVHADDLRSGVQSNHQFIERVHLDKHVQPSLRRMRVELFEFEPRQRRNDQQDGIRARRTRLENLIAIDDEVLAKQRQLRRGADRRQVIERAVEEHRLGQDRDRSRSGAIVGARDFHRFIGRAQHAA